jgi:hypothetical protein
MKITICGSTAFIDEMETVSKQLEALNHEVKMPPVTVVGFDGKDWHTRDYYKLKKTMPTNNPEFWNNHTQRIRAHFDKVAWSEAVLITNYDKNNIANYIGPNTLMEMGLAFHLSKTIFLLNPVPETAWKEEILGMRPVVINGNFDLIK